MIKMPKQKFRSNNVNEKLGQQTNPEYFHTGWPMGVSVGDYK